MPYQKPVFYAQTAPQGSYAASCPTNVGSSNKASRGGNTNNCLTEFRKCKNCAVEQ